MRYADGSGDTVDDTVVLSSCWLALPEYFERDIDSILTTSDGGFYIIKGCSYVHYANATAQPDSKEPRSIRELDWLVNVFCAMP